MNNGGDAAEQVVRLSLEGFEVAAKLTGTAAKELTVLLVSVLKQEQKTKGKARLTNMLNQASTDRIELAKLLNISDTQISYVTNVDAGHGLIKVGSSLIPFSNKFPKNTKLYRLMTTKPGESA